MSELKFQYFGGRGADLGKQIIQSGGHAVIGVSICNAFFKTEQCEILLKKAADNFDKVTFYSCDIPYEHNLRALGYEEAGIPKKVTKEIRSLRRKLRVALQKLPKEAQEKLTDYGRFKQGPRFIEWADIEKDQSYLDALERMKELFATNKEFKQDVLVCAESFMDGKMPPELAEEGRLAILMESKNYVLKEWASFQVLPEILPELVDGRKGKSDYKDKLSGYETDSTASVSVMPDDDSYDSDSSPKNETSKEEALVYLYHRRVPLLETFLGGKYTHDPPYDTMGHAVLGPDNDAHVNLYAGYHK